VLFRRVRSTKREANGVSHRLGMQKRAGQKLETKAIADDVSFVVDETRPWRILSISCLARTAEESNAGSGHDRPVEPRHWDSSLRCSALSRHVTPENSAQRSEFFHDEQVAGPRRFRRDALGPTARGSCCTPHEGSSGAPFAPALTRPRAPGSLEHPAQRFPSARPPAWTITSIT
jgi:hypothetical protein